MLVVVRCASILAFAVVAGCAGGKSIPNEKAMVTVSAIALDEFGLPRKGTSGRLNFLGAPQESQPQVFPPMSLRVCNQARTECALGKALVKAGVKVESLSAKSATVTVNLDYQVGRSQTVSDDTMQTTSSIPSGVQTLRAKQAFSKTVELAYGEVRHVQLPYGVDVAVCVAMPNAGEFFPDPRVCQGLDKMPDPSSDLAL